MCSLGVSEQEEGGGRVQSLSLVLCVQRVQDGAGGVQAGAVGVL